MRIASVSFTRKAEFFTQKARDKGLKFLEMTSFFPVDRHDCLCQTKLRDIKTKLSLMTDKQRQEYCAHQKMVECPRPKTGMQRFEIVCRQCEFVVARVWAKDKTIQDFCDLHYVSCHDADHWHGSFTVNISPYSGKLGFECACGQDSRDHGDNRDRNTGDFVSDNSKFFSREVKNG